MAAKKALGLLQLFSYLTFLFLPGSIRISFDCISSLPFRGLPPRPGPDPDLLILNVVVEAEASSLGPLYSQLT